MSMDTPPLPEPVSARLSGAQTSAPQTLTMGVARFSIFDRDTNTVTLMSSIGVQAPTHNDELKFQRLASQWLKDTLLSSSVTRDHAHPAHLAILAMGKIALPLILKELQQNGGHWFLALRLISDENPVPAEHAGRIKEMREDWITWGRQHGYL